MASQMLVSVKGMSACTTPNEASASTTEASCGVSQQTRTCVRTPIGRYLRVGVRHKLNRTADLDGEVDAEPGLKIRALCIIALAELVERGCNEVRCQVADSAQPTAAPTARGAACRSAERLLCC